MIVYFASLEQKYLCCLVSFDIIQINQYYQLMIREHQNESLYQNINFRKKHSIQENKSKKDLVQNERQIQNSSKTYFLSPQKYRSNITTTKDISSGKKITQSNQEKSKQKIGKKHQKVFSYAADQDGIYNQIELQSNQLPRQRRRAFNANNIQNKPFIKQLCMRHDIKQVEFICTAPECNNYRQLCAACAAEDLQIHESSYERRPNSPNQNNLNSGSLGQLSAQSNIFTNRNKNRHRRYHIPVEEAYNQTRKSIQQLYKGLRGIQFKIRNQIQMNVNNYLGYDQVSLRLDDIRQLLEQKINKYKIELKRVYQKHIKQKLQKLYETTENSIHFLDKQRFRINQRRSIQFLKPFYTNDLHYDIRYYESYLTEVLEKKAKQFKTGLDNDKIFKMMVAFQQNLQQIFKTEKEEQNSQKMHAFIGDGYGMNRLYQIKDSSQELSQGQLQCEQVFIEKSQNQWDGPVASVFFPQKDSFYLFGQGSKESSLIQRYTPSSSEHRTLGNMDVKRKNFSVCLLNNQIFIIGGQNQKEGTLVKCQKYVPSINKVYLISSLNQRSAKHSITTFKDKFILKFGGTYHMDFFSEIGQSSKQLQYDQVQGVWKNKKFLALDWHYYCKPEIYSIQTQEWQVLSFSLQMNSMISQPFVLGINPMILKSGSEQLIILSYENYANGFQYYFRSHNQQKEIYSTEQNMLKFWSGSQNQRNQNSSRNINNKGEQKSKTKSKSNERFRDKSKKKIKEFKQSIISAANNNIKCKKKRFLRYQLKIMHDDKQIKQVKIQSKQRKLIHACFYIFPFKDYSHRNMVYSLVLTDPIKKSAQSQQKQTQIFQKYQKFQTKDKKGLAQYFNKAWSSQRYKSTDFQKANSANQSRQPIQSNQQLIKDQSLFDSPQMNKFLKQKDKDTLSHLIKVRNFPL